MCHAWLSFDIADSGVGGPLCLFLSLGRDQLEWSVRYRYLLYISEVFADSMHGVCVGAEFCLGASFNCIRHKIVRSRKVGVAVAFDPFLGALCYERRMGRCYYDSIDECLRGIWAWLLVWIHDCAGIVGGELALGGSLVLCLI